MTRHLMASLLFLNSESLLYLMINTISSRLPSRVLMLESEQTITFRERSLWPYVSFVPFCIITAMAAFRQRGWLRAAAALLANSAVSYISFIKTPSRFPRPAALHSDGDLRKAWEMLHKLDKPSNTFPSIHVGHSVLLALMLSERDAAGKNPGETLLLWALIIAASTLMAKQHYVVDVRGGLIAASVLFHRFFRGHRSMAQIALRKELGRLAENPGRYGYGPGLMNKVDPRLARLMRKVLAEGSFLPSLDAAGSTDVLENWAAGVVQALSKFRALLTPFMEIAPSWFIFYRLYERHRASIDFLKIRDYIVTLDAELVQSLHLIVTANGRLAVQHNSPP